MTPAKSRLKAAGYHVIRLGVDESCYSCTHRREVAKRARPLELRFACRVHRAAIDRNGWCLKFARATS